MLQRKFLNTLASKYLSTKYQFIIITHIMDDWLEFFRCLSKHGIVSTIIAIPYSKNNQTIQKLEKQYNVLQPNLEQMLKPDFMLDYLAHTEIDFNQKSIIIEIGGYFSNCTQQLRKLFNDNLLGIIEDTAAGWHRYNQALKQKNLYLPVVSVAKSQLKRVEDFLVGERCAEIGIDTVKTLKSNHERLCYGVIGVGRIGYGVYHNLLRNKYQVITYDQDHTLGEKNINFIYDRDAFLQQADVIFGATGNHALKKQDFNKIKKDSILISCSSKLIEFDLEELKNNYKISNQKALVQSYIGENNRFYVLNEGKPINFSRPDYLIGNALYLTQAELLISIKTLEANKNCNQLFENSNFLQNNILELWLEHFAENTQLPQQIIEYKQRKQC